MALSKVLKDYIIKKYEAKIKDIEKNRNNAVNEAATLYSKKENLRAIELCDALYPQIAAIKQTIKDAGLSCSYHLQEMKNHSYMFNVPSFPINLKQTILKPFDDEILKLNKERDKLLIRLSLEKDFERISAILTEHSIEL